MSALLNATLDHLRALVAFDTRNPPRSIGTDGIFDYLRGQLPGFECVVTDHGAGAVSLFAHRGKPRIVFNVHLDTVPSSPGWTQDPFTLRVTHDRAIGLGACDIKGAAAALLTAAMHTQGDAALLFTTDEEANDARCIAAFLQGFPSPAKRGKVPQADGGALDFEAAIIAEPTNCEAVLAHRGISSAMLRFTGEVGHASAENALAENALHQTMRWGSKALDYVAAHAHERFGGMTGLRFNVGRVEGGIKANMIAPFAEVRFGFRPLPSMNTDVLLAGFRACADNIPQTFVETFRGPALPSGDIAGAESRRLAARDLADELGLPIGNAVDFWTEASLFSAAGLTAFVYGPGDIAQAHTADEWVELSQLLKVTESYMEIIDRGHE